MLAEFVMGRVRSLESVLSLPPGIEFRILSFLLLCLWRQRECKTPVLFTDLDAAAVCVAVVIDVSNLLAKVLTQLLMITTTMADSLLAFQRNVWHFATIYFI